jgi:plastocyanin
MKPYTSILAVLFALFTLAWNASVALADNGDDNGNKLSVTVSFGAGLNTAQPGNKANHHVLPPLIKVKKGGVVNFVVAGFHQPIVYKPGVRAENIIVPASGLFIDDTTNPVYYTGISPVTPPPVGISNTQNRVESVSFSESGTYLVICNVRPHFLDGMYAIIKVND